MKLCRLNICHSGSLSFPLSCYLSFPRLPHSSNTLLFSLYYSVTLMCLFIPPSPSVQTIGFHLHIYTCLSSLPSSITPYRSPSSVPSVSPSRIPYLSLSPLSIYPLHHHSRPFIHSPLFCRSTSTSHYLLRSQSSSPGSIGDLGGGGSRRWGRL